MLYLMVVFVTRRSVGGIHVYTLVQLSRLPSHIYNNRHDACIFHFIYLAEPGPKMGKQTLQEIEWIVSWFPLSEMWF